MNNFKKVGLSALAGSLAMMSAHAGDFTVTGGAELTYTSKSTQVTGNPLGLSQNIKFTGTGEVNGIAYTVYSDTAGQDFGSDSAYVKFDFGDMGTLAFEQGADSSGIGSLANNTPTAYEEADHQSGALGDGLDRAGDTGVIAYNNTISDFGVSIEFNPAPGGTGYSQAGASGGNNSAGSNINYALKYSIGSVALAMGQSMTEKAGSTPDDDEFTVSANYTMGAVEVGAQRSSIEMGASTAADYEVTAYAIAFNVNDQLSVSYGISDNTKDNPSVADVTEENQGIMAAYSMGSAAFRISMNSTDNVNGVAGTDREVTEVSLNLSF